MDHEQLMSELEALAERLDISLRRTPLGGDGGGLCAIKGVRILFIDTDADRVTQLDRSLAEIAQLPEINTVFVEPELRDALDRARTAAG
jgi:hypothetical protein